MKKQNSQRGKMIKILPAMLAAFMLTGCSNQIPEMSAEQEQIVGEYAAMLLLKYDANHRSRLVDLSLYPEKPVVEQEPEQEQESQMRPTEDTPVIDQTQAGGVQTTGSMEEFFGLPEGVSLTYQGYSVCASYPENGEDAYFALDAAEGKSLVVLTFAMSNQSGAGQSIDLLNQKPVFKVTVNGDYTRTALVTMLLNDMVTYKGDVAAGETKELVVLVEVDSQVASQITSLSLELKNESNGYTISLF